MKTSRFLPLPISWLALTWLVLPSNCGAQDIPRLGKGDGPYMVLAYSLRGPDAEARAKTLATELKSDHSLPSFVYEDPKRPGDTFLVLVGNCKTAREAFDLKNRVKKIQPKSLSVDPLNRRGRGLSRAVTTTNPLADIK
jgi:hypothetical protein